MSFTEEQIKKISEKLNSLPPISTISTRDAVKKLKADILGLKKKGYTLEQINDILTEEGIKLSLATLKSYIGGIRTKRKSKQDTPPAPAVDDQKPTFVLPDHEEI